MKEPQDDDSTIDLLIRIEAAVHYGEAPPPGTNPFVANGSTLESSTNP
jgi:hypothetical protein